MQASLVQEKRVGIRAGGVGFADDLARSADGKGGVAGPTERYKVVDVVNAGFVRENRVSGSVREVGLADELSAVINSLPVHVGCAGKDAQVGRFHAAVL